MSLALRPVRMAIKRASKKHKAFAYVKRCASAVGPGPGPGLTGNDQLLEVADVRHNGIVEKLPAVMLGSLEASTRCDNVSLLHRAPC